MKLLELEIADVRGIRHLHLQPDGRNLVIWGPNGSGKSAVIDAVDYLFTGRMRRLIGEGTAGITLKKHGPHIDAAATDSFVRGVVRFNQDGEPVELLRRLSTNKLEVGSEQDSSASVALEIASRGQNILTRREILKFITADAGTRGEQIQALLDLVNVETTRKALAQAENRCRERWSEATAALTQARSRLAVLLGKDDPDTNEVLDFINEKRKLLGADPLPNPSVGALKEGIASPDQQLISTGTNPETLRNSLDIVRHHCSHEGAGELKDLTMALQKETAALQMDTLAALKKRSLISTGLSLLDESGKCPLCELEWNAEELRASLEAKHARLNQLAGQLTSFAAAGQQIQQRVSTTTSAIATMLMVLPETGDAQLLKEWRDKLHTQLSRLQGSPEEVIEQFNAVELLQLYSDPELSRAVEDYFQAAESVLGRSAARVTAWDSLTILEEALRSSSEAGKEVRLTAAAHKRASELSLAYRTSRDAVLQELYNSVRERFVDLYKALHTPDESSFSADLLPKGGGIDFLVDFYGHGSHPPHALHSEGHQDSMGLCLFLSLLERLSDERMNLVLLDDVVMSVDADHRRRVGKILRSVFPDVQFIITTHDRTWANQLRTEKVVSSNNTIQFYGWHLSTGPRVLYEGDLWDQIDASLKKDDVPAASHRLRRGAEEYFQSVCDALRAPVRFSLGGRLELGDFVGPAMSRLKTLIKQSKAAANSWNAGEALKELEEVESTAKQVFTRTSVEQWAVNETVHYNAWENLAPDEFRPVVEAFQDLFDIYRCSACSTLLRVEQVGNEETTVRCDCGAVAWNLKKKT